MADVAVIAKDYRSRTSGVAFALGEQPLKSFHSVRNMVRLSLGEALTNLVFGNVMRYGDIHLVLSFNCAGKLRGETARMYECCEEVKEAVMALSGGGEREGLGEHGGAHGERNGEGTVALSSRRRHR